MVTHEHLSEKGKKDFQIITRALNGDQSAYSELLEKYRNALYYMLLEKVNDEEVAEDLTMEALGKAFMKLHQYKPDFVFSTWLFRIAIHNCIDYLRRKPKIEKISIDNIIENEDGDKQERVIPSNDDNPEQAIMKIQRLRMIRRIVDQLPESSKVVIKKFYFEELTYQEIADDLNLPIGTIRAQLHRSREKLYNILSGKTDGF